MVSPMDATDVSDCSCSAAVQAAAHPFYQAGLREQNCDDLTVSYRVSAGRHIVLLCCLLLLLASMAVNSIGTAITMRRAA